MSFVGPYPVADAIARLRAVAMLRFVGNCADLETALKQSPRVLPAAYVVAREQGSEPKGASGGVLIQQVTVSLCVVLYVNNYAAQDTGAAARDEMDALIRAVRGALLNRRPASAPAVHPLSFHANRDEMYSGGSLVTQEIYRSSYRIEVRP
ncbi:phage tail terminator protein [Tahibacter soli]|uniref:Uncharacterized protein n=1 Tax=Tahibacter soli TaxID=2983605 RepID=A0A9X3YLJ6_9GAMM|nr:hypothetical protein [Tahibacter soli]MDC8012938.1 hypothetical protein [Tahibacter soli]